MSGKVLIEARELCWRAGARDIVDGVSLTLREGELVGLIGPNGAGKSSLLRLLARAADPHGGSLHWRGRPYGEAGRQALAAGLAYLEQHAAVHWPLRVETVVALGRLPHGAGGTLSAEDRRAIAEAAHLCGISHLLERRVTTLSAGERVLAGLARLLAGRPQAALADEPVAALDPRHQLRIMGTLQRLARERGLGALVVLHDLGLAARFCDRLILLHAGRVEAEGGAREVLTAANLARCYGIRADILLDGPHPHVIPLEES